MPLASAGLIQAAAVVAAAQPTLAAAPSPVGDMERAEEDAAPFGSQLAAAFQQWVKSPLATEQVEFREK